MASQPFVQCDSLVKIYKVADLEVVALQGLDLEVAPREMIALVGPSGAGKSTLLNVIGGLDVPSAGRARVGNWDLLAMKAADRVRYKRQVVGFVWQQTARNLLPYLTARENVELPMLLAGKSNPGRRKRALELLEVVDLGGRVDFRPDRLSGGEQQRAALAVALANNPSLLMGDEISGQIDSQSAKQVYRALRRVNRAFGTTIILVTHDPLVARLVDRVVAIRDGRTSTEIRRRRDAESGAIHEEEWVILDQAGRLQIPKPYVETLGMRERVKLRLEENHVSVWPQERVEAFIRTGAAEAQTAREPQTGPAVDLPAVELDQLGRTFQMGTERIAALEDVSLTIPAGKLIVVRGRSGSGKTTLLNLIAGLDEPTSGSVTVGGRPLQGFSTRERVQLRRRHIGFVFQSFGLLPYLSVAENVEVPLRMVRAPLRERRARVDAVLAQVGLTGRARHRAYELSGGEQQRAAIARALVNRPELILADEPTGQLDSATGASIVRLLRDVVDQTGVTIIIASHDAQVWQAADLVFELRDGQLLGREGSQNDRAPSHSRSPKP